VAAEAVDSVHLPTATDPYTVLTHIRAAARHPGPLLVHLGGHLVTDRRTGRLNLALRDTRPSALRADALPWSDVAAQLRARPPEWGTLVIADLTAEPKAMPLLRTVPSPLAAGLPLWGAISSDPDQVGIFTRALVEVLHTGRPGAGPALTPQQIQSQVQSVLRPDTIVVSTYDSGFDSEQVAFRNTARRAVTPTEAATDPTPGPVPPMPAEPPTAHLTAVAPADPSTPEPTDAPLPTPDPLSRHREAVTAIVSAADSGEHRRAAVLAAELESEVAAERGDDTPAVLQVRQVRAHVARLSGEQAEAAGLYREVALELLRVHGAEHDETLQAAANAEACWRAVEDEPAARRIGRGILDLRRSVPGEDGRRLRAAERYQARLTGSLPEPLPALDPEPLPALAPAPDLNSEPAPEPAPTPSPDEMSVYTEPPTAVSLAADDATSGDDEISTGAYPTTAAATGSATADGPSETAAPSDRGESPPAAP
jgi:hypothetical protein